MIELKGIKKIYAERTVLDIEGLTFKKGETVAIVGPNGSGKSTLLKIIAGVIKGDEGNVISEDKIFYLPQKSVPFGKSLRKNLMFSMKAKEGREERADEMLLSLGLSALSHKNAKGLSGGEGQRLALGRILVNEGDFLLLDEPTSAQDIEGTEIIEKALSDYKEKRQCGIIMTTHSPSQAFRLADRIIMLNKGRVEEDTSPVELSEKPQSEWGKRFINMWKL